RCGARTKRAAPHPLDATGHGNKLGCEDNTRLRRHKQSYAVKLILSLRGGSAGPLPTIVSIFRTRPGGTFRSGNVPVATKLPNIFLTSICARGASCIVPSFRNPASIETGGDSTKLGTTTFSRTSFSRT